MKNQEAVVVFVTASSQEEANNIAQLLLDSRKAACINIVPKVDSFFWWQDKLDSAQESLLIIKTKASVLPEVSNLVKSVHSYEVPEIIALPIIGGNDEYLGWLNTSVEQ